MITMLEMNVRIESDAVFVYSLSKKNLLLYSRR